MACISYLTQKKENLNKAEAANIGGQIYGCDLCQICCPMNNTKNRLKELSREELFDMLSMEEGHFKERFGHTAMAWRGLTHFKRNLKIVMENIAD
jgi:epoxyqueuosine reductase